MTLSTIDPMTALVVIDLQKSVMQLPTAHSSADIVDRAAELAREFRRHSLPVVLVTAIAGAPGRTESRPSTAPRPPDAAELAPGLEAQSSDHLVRKQRWGAFYQTDLDEHLRELGVTQIVLTGIATSFGVESTARAAHEHGYNVTLAIDAMTDMSAEAHRNSIERIFPRLGETGTTAEIVALLDTRPA